LPVFSDFSYKMIDEAIKTALKQVRYPGFSRDIVSFGLVRAIEVKGPEARIQLALTTSDPKVPAQIKKEVEEAAGRVEGIERVEVEIAVTAPKAPPPAASGARGVVEKLPGVRFSIAVASGKGGVGKSTFAVNIACAMAAILRPKGGKVGLMDCDIHGPSVPLMIGLNARPQIEENMILPLENFGVKVMSMGLLIDDDAPVVWRGPMIMKTIQQFAQNVRWGELEILVIDLPPGTGDAQLSLVQTIPLDGAVIVTTPQAVAANVTRRGAMMFEKVNVPLIGVAENMSYLEVNGEKNRVFGEGGGARTAAELQTNFLGELPLDPEIRQGGDAGVPVVIGSPQSPAGRAFLEMADRILQKLSQAEEQEG
jgi:ATP-binding protein involved in chromosome partitioning